MNKFIHVFLAFSISYSIHAFGKGIEVYTNIDVFGNKAIGARLKLFADDSFRKDSRGNTNIDKYGGKVMTAKRELFTIDDDTGMVKIYQDIDGRSEEHTSELQSL